MARSGEAERDSAQPLPEELTIIAPDERLESVLRVIRSAQHRLVLSLFRCDHYKVLDGMAEALRRKVRVEALLTLRAKGWKKRLKDLSAFLEGMGAVVYRYSDAVVKYHAKYLVADDGPALIASLNFTRKCFSNTCDFLHLTHDPEVVSGLKRLFEADCTAVPASFREDLGSRLIVGPERARAQLTALLEQARHSIRIIDPKVNDPSMVALLEAKRDAGVVVEVLGGRKIAGLLSHGKMILVDGRLAVIGSISLSALSLGFRREVAVMVRDSDCVSRLKGFFEEMAAGTGKTVVVQEELADDEGEDDEELEDSD